MKNKITWPRPDFVGPMAKMNVGSKKTWEKFPSGVHCIVQRIHLPVQRAVIRVVHVRFQEFGGL